MSETSGFASLLNMPAPEIPEEAAAVPEEEKVKTEEIEDSKP